MKPHPLATAFILVISSICFLSEAVAKENQVILSAGINFIPGTAKGLYEYGELAYLRRHEDNSGFEFAVAAGPKNMYRALSGAFNFYIWRDLRLGGGGSFAYPLNELSGNPILLPMPEVLLGYEFKYSEFSVAVCLKQNLFFGTRANLGLGYSF
jgi:hypothetical protein